MLRGLAELLVLRKVNLDKHAPTLSSPVAKCTQLSGLSNISYKLTFENPEVPPMVIKFYNTLFHMFVSRSLESKVLSLTSKNELSPKIYAQEDWGYIYEYVEG